MTELEKYELVNQCDTIEDLANAILAIANGSEIQGRQESFDAEEMAQDVEYVVKHDRRANVLTRKYGIRQQALYLKYYS